MDMFISNDNLTKLIASQGRVCADLRQVTKRLDSLLPLRLSSIKQKYRQDGIKATKSEYLALTDAGYTDFLEEFVEVASSATEARIQYETHLMLFKARQSLRSLRK